MDLARVEVGVQRGHEDVLAGTRGRRCGGDLGIGGIGVHQQRVKIGDAPAQSLRQHAGGTLSTLDRGAGEIVE